MVAVICSQGDIVEFDFNPPKGHEPAGRRPALVVSSNSFNVATSMTLVCPITTTKSNFPLHMPLPNGLKTYGNVVIEQMRAFDLEARNAHRVETIPKASGFMDKVRECLRSFF